MIGLKKRNKSSRRRKTNRRKKSGRQTDMLLVKTHYAKKGAKKTPASVEKDRMYLVALLAVILLLGAGIITGFGFLQKILFSKNSHYTLQTIQVNTDGVLKRSQLLGLAEQAHAVEGANLFAFDLADLQHQLESEAIIRDVKVRRQLPDELEITVTERKPMARLGHARAPYHLVVDEDGVLIRKSFRATHLPLIYGSDFARFSLGDSIAETPGDDALFAIKVCNDRRFSSILRLRGVVVGNDEYLTLELETGDMVLVLRNSIRESLRVAAGALQVARSKGHGIARYDLRYGKTKDDEPRVVVESLATSVVVEGE